MTSDLRRGERHCVGLGGLEPPTSALSGQRSNRLSYRPAKSYFIKITLVASSYHREAPRSPTTQIHPRSRAMMRAWTRLAAPSLAMMEET